MKHIKLFENDEWIEDWEEEDPDIANLPLDKPNEFYVQYIDREVMIRPDSKYWGINRFSNPKDVVGIITDIYTEHVDDHIIRVKWLKRTNVYRPEDLMLV